jgi:hypothetical protein
VPPILVVWTAACAVAAVLPAAAIGAWPLVRRSLLGLRPLLDAGADGDPAQQQLDETLEETFPASDPPAFVIHTGVRIAVPPWEGRGPTRL